MKGIRIAIMFGVLGAFLLMASCHKEEKAETVMPRAIPSDCMKKIDSLDRTSGNYWMISQVGHDGKNCPGCVLRMGRLIHIDCMRYGRNCRLVAKVQLDTLAGTAITVDTFDLTSEDFFAMPARSMIIMDPNDNLKYLNVPEQIVYRDTLTQQFTFTGLFLSEAPGFSDL